MKKVYAENIQETGLPAEKYIEILKEINEWEAICCESRGETIEELSEIVYPEIIDYLLEDGYDPDEVRLVNQHRQGDDLEEWKKI